ncbi:MAG: hypothetical protein CM1200mP18_13950 [Gammaproteobacteria bacterium]|nr:MAG: hypothetical protein CM1200mP18_13950 [Gammaproteobacteria bacterium]
MKPTQAMEDGITRIAVLDAAGHQFKMAGFFAVDGYVEHRERVDRIVALLPEDFKAGMESWGVRSNCISPTQTMDAALGPDRRP